MGGYFSIFRWLYGRVGATPAAPVITPSGPYFLAVEAGPGYLAAGQGAGGFLSRSGG